MILETTPYNEALQIILSEREKVKWFEEKESEKVKKLDSKGKIKKVYTSTYTIPASRNTYLFIAYIGGPTDIHNRFGNPSVFQYGTNLIINTDSGSRMVYSLTEETNKKLSLTIHTGHFFRRYRERCGFPETMPTNELIAHFYGRNTYIVHLDFGKMSINSDRYKDGIAIQMNDGIAFGRKYPTVTKNGETVDILKMNTFITEKELFKDQKKTIITREKTNKKMLEAIKEMLRKEPALFEEIMEKIIPIIKNKLP